MYTIQVLYVLYIAAVSRVCPRGTEANLVRLLHWEYHLGTSYILINNQLVHIFRNTVQPTESLF